MSSSLTLPEIQRDPTLLAAQISNPSGLALTFRPLDRADAASLGAYFIGLSEDTTRRYGPHPFDQTTADQFCAAIDFREAIRMIATIPAASTNKGGEQVIAYFILQLDAPQGECERYSAAGITLDPQADCIIAPSLADAYQNRGLGTPLMEHIFSLARRLGRKHILLNGGVYLSNERAVHYYEKLGFQRVRMFESPPAGSGKFSYDMWREL
jgi:GNAT superfamily N-acetyltransferase